MLRSNMRKKLPLLFRVQSSSPRFAFYWQNATLKYWIDRPDALVTFWARFCKISEIILVVVGIASVSVEEYLVITLFSCKIFCNVVSCSRKTANTAGARLFSFWSEKKTQTVHDIIIFLVHFPNGTKKVFFLWRCENILFSFDVVHALQG